MIPINFGENLLTGRPAKTPAQLAEDRALAAAYLERRGAGDLAEMLGIRGVA